MRVSLPRLRCLEDTPPSFSTMAKQTRHHTFIFAPPPYGPQQIGIVFPRYTAGGYPIIEAVIVSPDYQSVDRVLEKGELLIVTADNLQLLHFIEDSGMFRRA